MHPARKWESGFLRERTQQWISQSQSLKAHPYVAARWRKKKQKYVYEIRTKLERQTLMRGQKINKKVLFHPEFRLWARSHHEQNQCILMGSLGLVDLRALFGRGKIKCAALSGRKSTDTQICAFVWVANHLDSADLLRESKLEGVIIFAV